MKNKPWRTALLLFIAAPVLLVLAKNAIQHFTTLPGWFEFVFDFLLILGPLIGGTMLFAQIENRPKK